MLNIFNRIPNLGVAIAEYLTAENKDSISVVVGSMVGCGIFIV